MKRRFICIAAASLMLAACADSSSVSDAGSSTAPDSTAESTVTADLSAEPVRSAYSGAEALFGMSFPGFEMPDSFEVPLVERVYELSYNNVSGENSAENSKEIFKRFFGERYDPSNELGNGSTGLMYRSKEQEIITEEQPDGSKAEIYAQDYGEIDNGFIILCDKQSYILSYHDSEFTRYRTATRGAELIETKAGEISVAQEASYIEKEVNELIGDAAAPFAVKVMFVDVYDIGKIAARCALTYDGVPVQYGFPAYEVQKENGKETGLYFCVNVFLSDDNVIHGLDVALPQNLIEAKQVDQILSLRRAVGILKETFTENDSYTFTDVKLLYCGRTLDRTWASEVMSDPEKHLDVFKSYAAETKNLRPTWCFFLNSETNIDIEPCVKIDAISGEVFLDFAEKKQ